MLPSLTQATRFGWAIPTSPSSKGQVPYTFTSDKNQKENLLPVNGQEVLRKIRELHLTSWNYMGHDPRQFRHYGPVAQEFFAAFGHDSLGTVGAATTIQLRGYGGNPDGCGPGVRATHVRVRNGKRNLEAD